LPGVRIGYMIAPKVFKESILTSKINTDIATSSLMQRVLEIYISKGAWKENIFNLRKEYKSRYNLMKRVMQIELADKVSFIIPGGGLNFYLKLKNTNLTSKELFFKLRERGVYITPGVLFYSKMQEGENTLRLSFSQTNEEKILKGIKIIREELSKCHM